LAPNRIKAREQKQQPGGELRNNPGQDCPNADRDTSKLVNGLNSQALQVRTASSIRLAYSTEDARPRRMPGPGIGAFFRQRRQMAWHLARYELSFDNRSLAKQPFKGC